MGFGLIGLPLRADLTKTGQVLGRGEPPKRGSCDSSKNSSQHPLPIRAQHHHPISPRAGQKRPSFTKNACFRNCGNMDSFTTPVRTSDFVLGPSTFGLVWRKRYISDSSDKGPLTQSLMDTQVEGDHGLEESPADKVNGKDVAQLDNAFLEAFENLHIGSPVGGNISCISCFCSCLRHRSQEENPEKDKMEE
ncbi:uncharacterized protein LOC117885358 isoform X2 [Trachemys scripta elegans]|uniref:uncharacterized protein LOC117885358 isoform X2 n=1 Tax=Trachemys scripta elegans TaxID=31138 RepID=UPI0015564973|nr:uncharacterized protein LOC117885358 isoform X2 [Trachemys scripta elegans]